LAVQVQGQSFEEGSVMASSAPEKTGMGLDLLRQQSEFRSLTPKQQRFVEEYCQNGCDGGAAANAAYTCKTLANAKIHSHQVLGHLGVQFCISLYFGNDPAAAFAEFLWRLITKRKINRENLQALMLYADIRKFRSGARQSAGTVFHDGLQKKRRAGRGTGTHGKDDGPIADPDIEENFLNEFKD
jgi:hypothetical protein